jgi:hypothetical protein
MSFRPEKQDASDSTRASEAAPRRGRRAGAPGSVPAGARGVLTYTLKPEGTGTKVTMTYIVLGAAGSLDKLAVPVDGVLAQAMQRFGNVGAVER